MDPYSEGLLTIRDDMKRICIQFNMLLVLLCCQAQATAGLLFNVASNNNSIHITTVKPNHTYPQAGIRITSPGFSLLNSGGGCTPNANGYCLFSVSDSSPANIVFNGALNTPFNIILCLNGSAPASCQHYTTSNASILYAGTSGGNVEISHDNGNTWTATTQPDASAVNAVFVTENGTLYAGTNNGNVAVSTNHGITWSVTTSPDSSAVLSLFLALNGTLYAGTSNGNVMISTDNGASWISTITQPYAGAPVFGLSVTPSGTLYTAVYCGASPCPIEYSSNNGASWTGTNSAPDPNTSANFGLFVTPNNTLYAGTKSGDVSYSTDNGNTWTLTTPPDGSQVHGLYVLANGTIYAGTSQDNVEISTDNGNTWTATTQPDGTPVNTVFVGS